jgi:hypothetical protein
MLMLEEGLGPLVSFLGAGLRCGCFSLASDWLSGVEVAWLGKIGALNEERWDATCGWQSQ